MQRITERERLYVNEVLDSQFHTSADGIMAKRLEKEFSRVFETEYAISFINGTATMHACLIAAGIKPGDEVIVPPLTFAATTFAVLQANAIPIYADINPLTWTIEPSSIEKLITVKTKAIIPVSIYGLSSDMDSIMAIAKKYDLFVLEDDAQCFMGKYKGRIVGSFADASSFSFQSSKHVTSGQGGMIITNNKELATKIRRLNSLGYAGLGARAGEGKIQKEVIQDPDYSRHLSMGWNYRIPELCAAVAFGQLERIEELILMRKKVANIYNSAHKGCQWLIPQLVPEDYVHSYWTYPLKLEPKSVQWKEFYQQYRKFGGDGIYAAWKLTYFEPALQLYAESEKFKQKYVQDLCPVAESIQPYILQFKTNYFDIDTIQKNSDILVRTINYFS